MTPSAFGVRTWCRYHARVLVSHDQAEPPKKDFQLFGGGPGGPAAVALSAGASGSTHTYQLRLGDVRLLADSTNQGCTSLCAHAAADAHVSTSTMYTHNAAQRTCRVVWHQVQQHAQAARVRRVHQRIQVRQRAEQWVYVRVVRHCKGRARGASAECSIMHSSGSLLGTHRHNQSRAAAPRAACCCVSVRCGQDVRVWVC